MKWVQTLAVSCCWPLRRWPDSLVRSLYGPFDLVWGYSLPGWIPDSRGILTDYLGGSPQQVPEAYRLASPRNFIGPDTPPTLLIQGESDVLVAPRHSRVLLRTMREAGRPCHAVFLPLGTHGSDFAFNGPFGQVSTFAAERFLRAVIK